MADLLRIVCDSERATPVSGLLYRKQVIYEGDFSQPDPKDPGVRKPWRVTREMVDNWATQGNLMLSRGVEVPCPKGHSTDPELKRATAKRFETGLDSKGRHSLFSYVEFTKPEYAEALAASNVSIYSEKKYSTGQHDYEWPPVHLAFTDYPVVPDLEPFEAVAASLLKIECSMDETLLEIAGALGVEAPEDGSDEVLKALILQQIKVLKPEEKKADPPAEDKKVAASRDPAILGIVRNARMTAIDALASGRHVTPAVAKELKRQYCGESIALSLDGTDRDFQGVVDTLKLQKVLGSDEKTQAQVAASLLGGKPGTASTSPLVRQAREARERADKTAAARRR